MLLLAASGYAIVRSLRLRRALVDGAYRARALWTAVGGVSVVAFIGAIYLDSVYGQYPTSEVGIVAEAVVWGAALILLGGWIITNINVAIAADFFNRDPLGWRKGGWVAMPCLVVTGFLLSSTPAWLLNLSPAAFDFWNNLTTLVFLAGIGYPTAVLGVTYLRIQDRKIKSYTLWVVLSIASLFAYVAPLGPGFESSSVLVVVPAVAFAYFMFRSVSALAIRTKSLRV